MLLMHGHKLVHQKVVLRTEKMMMQQGWILKSQEFLPVLPKTAVQKGPELYESELNTRTLRSPRACKVQHTSDDFVMRKAKRTYHVEKLGLKSETVL